MCSGAWAGGEAEGKEEGEGQGEQKGRSRRGGRGEIISSRLHCWAQSPSWGWILQTRDHDWSWNQESDTQPTEPPRRPLILSYHSIWFLRYRNSLISLWTVMRLKKKWTSVLLNYLFPPFPWLSFLYKGFFKSLFWTIHDSLLLLRLIKWDAPWETCGSGWGLLNDFCYRMRFGLYKLPCSTTAKKCRQFYSEVLIPTLL